MYTCIHVYTYMNTHIMNCNSLFSHMHTSGRIHVNIYLDALTHSQPTGCVKMHGDFVDINAMRTYKCVFIYVYMHVTVIRIHTRRHTYTRIRIHKHTCTNTHKHMRILGRESAEFKCSMCLYTFIHVICIRSHACFHTNTHTRIHTYHIHTGAHTHTHICTG